MKNSVSELQSYFCPFGYSDVKAICEIGEEVELHEEGLFEIIDNSRESFGAQNWDNFDPVYSVLDHVMQTARSKVSEVTGYDFITDFSGNWTAINVQGDFMCSNIDYSDDAVTELISKISWNITELVQDKFCQYFFGQLNICR